jgi:hypothetical protein
MVGVLTSRHAETTASIYREQIFKLETELARTAYDYEQLTSKHSELSKRLKEDVVEIVRADGSRETRRSTDRSEDSSQTELTALKIKYEQDLIRLQAEYADREIINNKFGLGISYDISGSKGIITTYDLHPNLGIGGGISLDGKVLDNIIIFGIIKF